MLFIIERISYNRVIHYSINLDYIRAQNPKVLSFSITNPLNFNSCKSILSY